MDIKKLASVLPEKDVPAEYMSNYMNIKQILSTNSLSKRMQDAIIDDIEEILSAINAKKIQALRSGISYKSQSYSTVSYSSSESSGRSWYSSWE